MTKHKQSKPRLDKYNADLVRKEVRRISNNELARIRNEVSDEISDVTVVAVAMMLRDEFDFGTQRIKRGLRRYLEQFNQMIDGNITLNDLKDTLKDEVGIDFENFEEEMNR